MKQYLYYNTIHYFSHYITFPCNPSPVDLEMESNTKRDSSIVNKKKKKKGDPTWGLNPKVEQHCTIVSLFYGIILRAVKQ